MQAETMMLPTAELEFVRQLSQFALPALALYVPATHRVHDPPLGPVEPALHVQSVCSTLASGPLEFDGHP